MSFVEDLATGNRAEKEFSELLGGDCIFNNDKKYDIFHVPSETFYEVKYDRMASFTGNVAVELSYNNRESGLRTTLADYFVYKIKGEFYKLSINELITLIKETSGKLVFGGDKKKSLLYLLPLKEILKYKIQR